MPVMIRRLSANNQIPNSNKNGPISNGHISNLNNNFQGHRKSFDFNQTLTYRKVMERVIKRFLLHKQREEQDEIREGDFEELKQDIQMLRFEMMNRLDETRDDLAKNSLLLNEGVLVVGELLTSLTNETNSLIKENFHLYKKNFYSTLDQIHSIDSGIDSTHETISSVFSTTSMPHLNHQNNSIKTILTSNSEPILSINDQNESDINPIQFMRNLSAVHITLSNITEEDDENMNKNEEEEEEEVEARHMSVQTSADNEDEGKSKEEIFSFKL
jgi:hypothetical protein